MSSSTKNVIIFGPTGGVGSAAAIEAHNRGAHVWLAMRDTNKAIPGLTTTDGGFTRVQADLAKPDTLKTAVKRSGAKAAFVYTLFGSPDSMASSFNALKESGIVYITLLSSFIVKGDPHNTANHASFIAKVHAQTEAALADSGIKYTAIRPAYFNSNTLLYLDGIKRGHVDVIYPKVLLDYIAPNDIGAVCGALLTAPPSQTEVIFMCGPKLMAQDEALGVIAKALGIEVEIDEVSEEEWKKSMKGRMPDGAIDTVAENLRNQHEGPDNGQESYPRDFYNEAAGSMKKYTGRAPTELGEWVKLNRKAFA